MNGFLDRAKKLLDEHDREVDRALDKVREQIDESAKQQYLDRAVRFAKERTGEGDTTE